MGKMKEEKEQKDVKWEKKRFLTALYKSQGMFTKGTKEENWNSFYNYMNDACMEATGSAVDESTLYRRCGTMKAQAKRHGGTPWEYPERPGKEVPKEPSMWQIMQALENGTDLDDLSIEEEELTKG